MQRIGRRFVFGPALSSFLLAAALFANACEEDEPACGDGVRAAVEACDGEDLNGMTCASLGYASGSLACSSECSFDFSDCQDVEPDLCGNGSLDGDEACDGDELGSATCITLGFTGGQLRCSAECTQDQSACTTGAAECGNGSLERGEVCDGFDFGGATCASLGFLSGTLACSADCGGIDTTGCETAPECGNASIDAGEECDGSLLDGASCETLGFATGTLTCNDCNFDLASCSNCGNQAIDANEDCDGSALGGETCNGLGFDAGSLSCDATCSFDTQGCSFTTCGNNVLNGNESCDGAQLNGQSCASLGYASGTLACNANCTFNDSDCALCGNDDVEGLEICDGVDFNGQTCAGLANFNAGALGCSANCTLDTSGCTNFEVGFCRLQFPSSITGASGSMATVYGRVYVAGLTDQSASNDLSPSLVAQLGYGPDGSSPSAAWTWISSTPNMGYNGGAAGEPNNDEYFVDFSLPSAGNYDFAYRFSADGGATWLFCDSGDAGSSDGYSTNNAGSLTVQ